MAEATLLEVVHEAKKGSQSSSQWQDEVNSSGDVITALFSLHIGFEKSLMGVATDNSNYILIYDNYVINQ